MTAFLLLCALNGISEGGIYFKNVNSCIDFKNKLTNQSYMKGETEQTYKCMCKLIPKVDDEKVRVY